MKLYTVKEAAKIVGVSTNTLYKYLDKNKIKAARGSAIQGRFRIPQSALEEFLGISLSPPQDPQPLATQSEADAVGSASVGQTIKEPFIPTEPLPYRKARLPLVLARLLLLAALFAVLIDLIVSRTVSLAGQLSRLFFLLVMLLLAYQEGGYRRT